MTGEYHKPSCTHRTLNNFRNFDLLALYTVSTDTKNPPYEIKTSLTDKIFIMVKKLIEIFFNSKINISHSTINFFPKNTPFDKI